MIMLGMWAENQCGISGSNNEQNLRAMSGEWYDDCDVSHLRWTGYR